MPDPSIDLGAPRRLHVTNVGGAGMSAVATLLAQMGHRVSGHDPAPDTPFLAPLRMLGVEIVTGPGPSLVVPGVDAVFLHVAARLPAIERPK